MPDISDNADSGTGGATATATPAPEASQAPAQDLAETTSTAPAMAPQIPLEPADQTLDKLQKESFGAKVYHGILNALGGSHDVTFDRDPATGKMTAHSTISQPGEQWKRIISGALTGYAGAQAAGTQGPGGAMRGAAGGIMAGERQVEQQYQQKRGEANEDLQTQQATALNNARTSMLTHQVAESSWRLQHEQQQADQEDVDRVNAFQQILQDGGPGTTDLGTFKSPTDAFKFAASYRQIHQDHANGRVFMVPDISGSGKKGGVRAAIVTPDWQSSPTTRDYKFTIQQPGDDGQLHDEDVTIPAGTKNSVMMQWVMASAADKNKRDLDAAEQKTRQQTAASEAGLRTAQSAAEYARADEERSQALLNQAKAAAKDTDVDWGPGGDKGFNSWHDKNVTPALGKETIYRLSSNVYNEYQQLRKQGKDFPTGAQSVQMLANHISGTFGNVKGARITKDLIEQHMGARNISDSAKVAIQNLTSGGKLSPAQWDAFFSMIGQSRDETWRSILDDAQALGRPLDYIAFPADLRARWGIGQGRVGQPLAPQAAAPAAGAAGQGGGAAAQPVKIQSGESTAIAADGKTTLVVRNGQWVPAQP